MELGKRSAAPEALVPILEHDSELGAFLSPADFALARERVRTPVLALARGAWDPGGVRTDTLSLLMLDGFVIRTVTIAGRAWATLLGPSTLLRPWEDAVGLGPVPTCVQWRVLHPTRLAILDARILSAVARWPGLLYAMFRRSYERLRIVTQMAAILCLQHVELRLLTLMWTYAQLWGRRTGDGIVVPVRLSHRDLAELVGSQRPTVSGHLSELADRGQVRRRSDRTWLLPGEPPDELVDLRVRGGVAEGESDDLEPVVETTAVRSALDGTLSRSSDGSARARVG